MCKPIDSGYLSESQAFHDLDYVDLSDGFTPEGHHFDIQSGMAGPGRLTRGHLYLCRSLRPEMGEHDHTI